MSDEYPDLARLISSTDRTQAQLAAALLALLMVFSRSVAVAVIFGPIVVFLVRLALARVAIDERGVTAMNAIRRRTIGWDDIAGVEVARRWRGFGGAFARIQLATGPGPWLDAVLAGGAQREDRRRTGIAIIAQLDSMARLNTEARGHAIARLEEKRSA